MSHADQRTVGAAVVIGAVLASTTAWAEGSGASAYDAADLTESGFVAAEQGTGDTINGGTLLVAAYAVFWTLMFAYVVTLLRRQRGVSAELNDLRKRMEDLDDKLDDRQGGAP